MNRNYGRSSRILAHMSKHPGRVFTADDIMSELHWPETERVATVSAASRLAYQTHDLEAVSRGSYVWRGGRPAQPETTETPASNSVLIESWGTLKDGTRIGRDENGNLYKYEQI